MKVKYDSDCGFFDGITAGKIYEVVEEKGTQYVVGNDSGSTSHIQKEKFIIMKK